MPQENSLVTKVTHHSRSASRRVKVVEEELVKGWYLKRTPVTGSQQTILSLCEWEVVLGRFVCSSPHISWEHVLFQKTQNEDVFIKDLKSVSGTFVNGKKIMAECLYQIHVGDRIALGKKTAKNPLDFEFEVCFTKEPLKLMVTKILREKKCATLKPCENRRHCNLHQSVEGKTELESTPSRCCSENHQPKGTTVNVATLKQPSSTGNATRTCNPNEWVKRHGSQLGECSQQDRKSRILLCNPVAENESRTSTSPKYTLLENSKTLNNPQEASCTGSFGKEVVQQKLKENPLSLVRDCYVKLAKEVVQEKLIENRKINPRELVRDCYVNLAGSKKLVTSYMQKNNLQRKKSEWAEPLCIVLSSSGSEEESAFFVKQKAKNVSINHNSKRAQKNNRWTKRKKHSKKRLSFLSDSQSEEENASFVKRKSKNTSGKQKRNKSKRTVLSESDSNESDEERTPFGKQEAESISLKNSENILHLSCSDSDEGFSFMKRKNVQSSVKHRNKYVKSESRKENIPGIVKRKCFKIIDSDGEVDEIPPFSPRPIIDSDEEADEILSTLSPPGDKKQLLGNPGRENSGDSVTSQGIPFDFEPHQKFMKSTVECNAHSQGQGESDENSCFVSSQVNKSKLEPSVSDSDINLGDTKRSIERTVPEDDHKNLQHIEVPDEEDSSDSLPSLCQLFSNTKDDAVNKQQQDETSIPSSSQAKLENLIYLNRTRKVSKTSLTVALPRQRRRLMTDKARAEVERFYENKFKSYNWSSKRRWLSKQVKNGKHKPRNVHDFRKKIQEQHGHRIRMPGGGSAIRRAPTGDKIGHACISRPTTAKLQVNQTRHIHVHKNRIVVNPVTNLPVLPKRAPKLTAEQRFPSRQESLIKDIKLKTVSLSTVARRKKLAESKIPLKLITGS